MAVPIEELIRRYAMSQRYITIEFAKPEDCLAMDVNTDTDALIRPDQSVFTQDEENKRRRGRDNETESAPAPDIENNNVAADVQQQQIPCPPAPQKRKKYKFDRQNHVWQVIHIQ